MEGDSGLFEAATGIEFDGAELLFEALHDLDACTFDGVRTTPGTRTTRDCNAGTGKTRVFTFGWVSHNYKFGFSYGSGVSGTFTGMASQP